MNEKINIINLGNDEDGCLVEISGHTFFDGLSLVMSIDILKFNNYDEAKDFVDKFYNNDIDAIHYNCYSNLKTAYDIYFSRLY